LESQYQPPACCGVLVTTSAFSAVAWSVMSWSNLTTSGWPTPTSVTVGAGMNDGYACALGVTVFTVAVRCTL
jgi:hypothetical protein